MGEEYSGPPLNREELSADPIEQFGSWFADAEAAEPRLPEGMVLATADDRGQPSTRTVLLKSFDSSGFVFFTNYKSRKAAEIATNPRAALLFWWRELERQVRIEGIVAMVSAEESDDYFSTRPRGSQLAAWASEQSRVIESREVLSERMEELTRRYAEAPVPRPPHWGGYRLTPHQIEFWQGRPDRLHDRFVYRRRAGGAWEIQRLAP